MTERPMGIGLVGVPYYGAEGEDYDYYESGDYARDVEEADWEAYYAMLEEDMAREEEEMRRSWTTDRDMLEMDVAESEDA